MIRERKGVRIAAMDHLLPSSDDEDEDDRRSWAEGLHNRAKRAASSASSSEATVPVARAFKKSKTPKKPKALAWDEQTPLITGVARTNRDGWYLVCLGQGKVQHTKDLDEANALRQAHNIAVAAAKAAETPAERRERHLAKRGGSSELERAFATRLQLAFASIEWECFILNDFTLADILVRPKGGEDWYPTQLKTATTKGERTNKYVFGNVSHYGKMLVVCHATEKTTETNATKKMPQTWLFDGETLAKKLPGGQLNITPKGQWDALEDGLLLGKCCADNVEACAHEAAKLIKSLLERANPPYPRTSKEAAQWTFGKPNHFAEFVALHFLMKQSNIPSSTHTLALPTEQGPHHDLVETCTDTGIVRRLQAKTARLYYCNVDGTALSTRTAAGLQVTLTKSVGDQKKGPYGLNDFDVLVVTWRDVVCDVWRVWRIPMAHIPRAEDGNLNQTLTVHVPRDAPLPAGVNREKVHGPPPRFKGDGRRGGLSETYDWTSALCTTYEMRDEWEPPACATWPLELAHMQRRKPVV